jgi:hypothetical protein
MIWLQWVIFFISLALQVYVIALLRRGAYKDYPFAFAYSVVLLLTTVADAVAHAEIVSLSKQAAYFYYYRNEAARQFLLFTVVVSLIERAMQSSQRRGRVRVLLAAVATCAVFVSLTIHSRSAFGLWMTEVARDLSFGAVVLTLLLWCLLISSRGKDHQLLMVTGGLGLQFTGEAIGQSLRQLSNHHQGVLFIGNLLGIMAHLLRLYVWLEAFRRPQAPEKIQVEPAEGATAFPRQAQTLFETI